MCPELCSQRWQNPRPGNIGSRGRGVVLGEHLVPSPPLGLSPRGHSGVAGLLLLLQVLGHMRASLGTSRQGENVWSKQEPSCSERPAEPLGLVTVVHLELCFSKTLQSHQSTYKAVLL